MSAFVVDDDTMHRCVMAICAKSRYGQAIPQFAGLYTCEPDSPTQIGRRLFTLNVYAVEERYPETAGSPGRRLCPSRTYTHKPAPALDFDAGVACLKALHCLACQCAEGDADKSAIYAELRAAIGTFADHLITSLPAYDRAPWG